MVLMMEMLLGKAALMGRGWRISPQPPSSQNRCMQKPPAMSRERLEERGGRVAAPCPSAQRWPAQSSLLCFPVTLGQGPCFGVWVQPWGPLVQQAVGATFPATSCQCFLRPN